MPHATIYSRYVAQSTKLRNDASKVDDANRDEGQRVWETPDQSSWSGNPLDIQGIKEAFDRKEMAQDYPTFLLPPFGSMGDTAACKLQSDMLGAQERAYRLRSQTSIRCTMHAAARRGGHGDGGMGNFARIDAYLQDLILAGQTKFRPK